MSKVDFIERLNNYLLPFEKSEYEEYNTPHPIIFVNGLPRSGTTLLMQYLTSSFEFGYINNLIARFWLSPLVGLRLSMSSNLSRNESDFSNFFGRTRHVSEPHEFSYFWKKWLQIEDSKPYDLKLAQNQINWYELSGVIKNMQAEVQAPFVFKGLHPCRHLKYFQKYFQNVIVIHIDRNPIEVARSLKKARIHHFGDPNHWWSVISSNYADIKSLDYSEQIPHQIYSLSTDYELNYDGLEANNLIRINFDDFLKTPKELMNRIDSRIIDLTGRSYLRNIKILPNQFKPVTQNEEDKKLDQNVQNLFN